MFLRTADRIFALRFLRLLTTPWKKTGAYKEGIIDDKGRKLRKPKTAKEKNVYNLFHKLVFNLKRLLNKIPFGKSTLASYAAALWLIKEHTGLSEKLLAECLYEYTGYNPMKDAESVQNIPLKEGRHQIAEHVILKDGSMLVAEALEVKISKQPKMIGTIFGYDIVEGTHLSTNQPVLVCRGKPKDI